MMATTWTMGKTLTGYRTLNGNNRMCSDCAVTVDWKKGRGLKTEGSFALFKISAWAQPLGNNYVMMYYDYVDYY